MAVSSVNLTIDKGTDFEATFNIFEQDSSLVTFPFYTGSCKIRKYPSSPTYHEATVGINTTNGEVKVSMAKTTTSLLSPGRNYYDVILTSITTNYSFKLVEGSIIVYESVSV